MKFSLNTLETNPGLLLMRVGLGSTMLVHGYPKLMNPTKWEFLGSQMQHIGINFMPAFWGFMASITEFGGGLFLILGLLTRFSSSMLAFTMLIATLFHINKGDEFGAIAHSLELGIAFAALAFLGAGKYSLDAQIKNKVGLLKPVLATLALMIGANSYACLIDLIGENLHPEGITYRAATGAYYVGSAANGSIQIVENGVAAEIQPTGTDGRIKALGLKVDEVRKRLWLVDGKNVYVYHVDTQALIKKIALTDVRAVKDSALNDLVLDQAGNAYVTDSFNAFVLKVSGDKLEMSVFREVPEASFGQQNNFPYNFNGIVLHGNSLIIVKTNDGSLWNLNLKTKKLQQFKLSEAVTKGDGLALDKQNRLYVIRNFENKVSVIQLDKQLNAKKTYQVKQLNVPGLDVPTTAAVDESQGTLVVVNSQFRKTELSHPFKLSVVNLK